MKNITKIYFLLFLISTLTCNAQLYGGIEIGSKGIKMSVINVENVKKGIYTVREFWTENVGIARGIEIDGKLAEEDMVKATDKVAKNYLKLKNEFKVEDKNLFVVASSGVGMASNTDVLVKKVKEATNKDLEIISAKLEAKLLLKGCIPPKLYPNSIILDIGGGNTKGGYVETFNDDSIVFIPVSLDLGTITLTEKINKKANRKTIIEYNELSFNYLTTLRAQTAAIFKDKPKYTEKQNVYLSGGAVWAFYTLFNEIGAKENYNEIKYEDVIFYTTSIQNNYNKYELLAANNPEIDKVLKTYSQKHLISAGNLLVTLLESIPNLQTKKIYFAKQGQIAWLLSYVADAAKGAKVIY